MKMMGRQLYEKWRMTCRHCGVTFLEWSTSFKVAEDARWETCFTLDKACPMCGVPDRRDQHQVLDKV